MALLPTAAAMAATMLGVLLIGVESGILLGVGLSLLLFLWRTSQPHIAVVGQLPGSEHFRNVERFAVVQSPVPSVRVDESLYFPNARFLEDRIAELIGRHPQAEHLVLMCPGVNLIDASALESLEAITARLHAAGIQLHLSEVKGPVMDRLRHSDFSLTSAARFSSASTRRCLHWTRIPPFTHSNGRVNALPASRRTQDEERTRTRRTGPAPHPGNTARRSRGGDSGSGCADRCPRGGRVPRRPYKWCAEHSPGVLEFKLSATPELAARDMNIVLYCKTSGRAALAAVALQDMGYLQVKSIAGGFDAWTAAHKPVVKPSLPSFD